MGSAPPTRQADLLAVEEPLEIRLGWRAPHALTRSEKTISITMRTPGHDLELAAGFLLGEGIVRERAHIASLAHCGPVAPGRATSNVVKLGIAEGVMLDLARLERSFYTTSSCGVCGKTSLEALRAVAPPALSPDGPRVAASVIHALPAAIRAHQEVFERTGGLHAAALFDPRGALLGVREDVGRHNAVDKLLGAHLLAGSVPPEGRGGAGVMLVSGRASFELVQKALMAGVPILAAVGAPSSLAVELARESGMTVLGFVREGRFNVYCGEQRIEGATPHDGRAQAPRDEPHAVLT